MHNFHNILFPDFLARVASASINFMTQICEATSGVETRKVEREIPIRKYSIKNILCTREEYQDFISFFQSRRGAGYAFRFKDYFDYKVKNQEISVKDKFVPAKYYQDAVFPNIRSNIFVIMETIKIEHNNKKINFRHEENTGFILDKPFQNDTIVQISFEFDVIARFNQDEVKYHLDSNGMIIIDNIELVEVIL
jgi:uncharacterized protein (TIGR02217 family)